MVLICIFMHIHTSFREPGAAQLIFINSEDEFCKILPADLSAAACTLSVIPYVTKAFKIQ